MILRKRTGVLGPLTGTSSAEHSQTTYCGYKGAKFAESHWSVEKEVGVAGEKGNLPQCKDGKLP